MGNSTGPASFGDSAVLEVTAKIMISTVIVLFVVITFLFILHLYARWFWSRGEDPFIVTWRRQLAQQNQPSTMAQRQRGLDSSTLQSLPVAVYNPKDFKDGLECAVCLSEVQEGEKARVLPSCNHGFHMECIDVWFNSHSSCPICRTLVVSSEPSLDSTTVEPLANEDAVNVSGHSLEVLVYPTNVLFWGDDTQVRSQELCSEEGQGNANLAASSASASGNTGRPHERLVIDIPMPYESCSPLSTLSATRVAAEDEAKSPVLTQIKSLKRLLSRGKRVSPSPCTSSSGPGDPEQV